MSCGVTVLGRKQPKISKIEKKWICIVFIAFTCGSSVYVDDDSLVSRLSICKFFSAAKHTERCRERGSCLYEKTVLFEVV